MRPLNGLFLVFLLLASLFQIEARAGEEQWLYQVDLESGDGIIELPDGPVLPRAFFLLFGKHSFEPGTVVLEKKEGGKWKEIGDKGSVVIGEPVSIDLFQELKAVPWGVPANLYEKGASCRFRVGRRGGVNGRPDRDEFWDQIIVVKESALGAESMIEVGGFKLIESGKFGEALPSYVRDINFSSSEIEEQEKSLTDPVMKLLEKSPQKELAWQEIESKALPLDYQKILLSGIDDPDPGYAYQNGQWFVVWPGNDGDRIEPNWNKRKDIWFAPAIRIGKEIVRPAPLSAKTRFFKNENGRTVPMLIVEWGYQPDDGKEKKVFQYLFSEETDGVPQIFMHLKVMDPQQEAKIVIGHGKRPNAHYWGDHSQAHTFVPYFTSKSDVVKKGDNILVDGAGSVVLRSSVPVRILQAGVSEVLLEFDAKDNEIFLSTPQVRAGNLLKPVTERNFKSARKKFEKKWGKVLSAGAYADVPSAEWKENIDSWLTQTCSITKILHNGKDKLSYGSYIYSNHYFGVEEGWATVALALWGKTEEAKEQAEILVSEENLDKKNFHHQYRNGLSSWYAALTARLAGDRDWFKSIAPALATNGYWTIKARRENEKDRSPIGKGLLPRHVYGGDIPTPAYSLYSNGTCLKGLIETADVFRKSELKDLQQAADDFDKEAVDFKNRLVEVMNKVLEKKTSPVFLPFALEVEKKAGNNEGPFERLTDDELGNYYNLFAPLFLHLEVFRYKDAECPSEWITDYVENHGGLFAGLPRFYTGLDAVYAIGYINELLEQSKADIGGRGKALVGLESFMIHGSSQNGHTIQEVSGFYPERLDWKEYERAVREAPWNFGMYSIDSYLKGHSSFTEPLGSGAGEGLWLIRKSLIDEMKDENGLPNGGLFLLSSVPSEWLKEGKEIKLVGFPTAYGTFDLHVKSFISSKREINVEYNYSRVLGKDKSNGKELLAWDKLDKILIRLVPAYEDRISGRKLKIKQPFTGYDEWTIELPAKEKGDLIVKF